MAEFDITVPCDPPGTSPDPAACLPPCPTPPIPEGRPEGYVQVCYDDGSTVILVIDRNEAVNDVCPPLPPDASPKIIGWINNANVYTPGAPPAGWHQCGAKSDVELAGRVCIINKADGKYVGSLFLLQTWDVSTDPPTYKGFEYEAVLADGTHVHPYTVPATAQLEPCPAGTEEPVVMHECVAGVCKRFVRWYNSVTKLPVADRNLDGTPYTVTSETNVGTGECPAPVRELWHECVGPVCTPYTRVVDCGTVTFYDATGTVATPTAAVFGPCPDSTHTVEFAHGCVAGVCTTYEIVKTIAGCDGTVTVAVHNLDGTPSTVAVATLTAGVCPESLRVVELVYDVQADDSCVEVELVKTFDCSGVATVTYLDLAGAVYQPTGTISTRCPCPPGPAPALITDLAQLRP